ncbi:hypothetical protein E2542_SST24830 [Spatholobus suberectus]|nr:hypothetical protein E2542_SST24830 [Spatholobus suberectus]
MESPNRTRVSASEKFECDGNEPIKQKRYRKKNVKKKSSSYRGVTKCKGRFEAFVWENDPRTTGKRGKTG